MRRALAFGTEAGVDLSSDDDAALAWLQEFFGPSLSSAPNGKAGPEVGLESSPGAHAELRATQPPDPVARPCFAFDQTVMSLPSWRNGDAVVAADDDRACLVTVRPSGSTLTGDPESRRWRHTLVWLIQEQIATRLRHSRLEVHAATVEVDGRAIVMLGPKRAGKTTVSFHLLRSGLVRWLANDRAFLGPGPEDAIVRGVPSAIRIRAATEVEFPELRAGMPRLGRLFLYNRDEISGPSPDWPAEPTELVLNPDQIAGLLGVERTAQAPLGSLVFPEIDPGAEGWRVEEVPAEEAAEGIWANLFGDAARERKPTLFEALDGGRGTPSRQLAEGLAAGARGYRAVLGRGAYEDPDFAARFIEAVGPGR